MKNFRLFSFETAKSTYVVFLTFTTISVTFLPIFILFLVVLTVGVIVSSGHHVDSFFMCIHLLNMLIAIMGESFLVAEAVIGLYIEVMETTRNTWEIPLGAAFCGVRDP